MRAILVLLVLAMLYALVSLGTDLRIETEDLNPILLGYGSIFTAGIVVAELLRPLLSLVSATTRFVVVAVLAALVWLGFELARDAGKIPEGLLTAEIAAPASIETPIAHLHAAWDGLFRTVAQVNNQSVGAIIDTGTPLVLLQYEEASRLGFHPETIDFNARVPVSDRKVKVAYFPLLSVRVEDAEIFNVEAAIAEQGALETNLIGLSYLKRLSGFALSEGELLLRP